MMTGIDQSDYSKLENGRRYMTFEQCRKLALALGTSMDYLAGLTDDDRPYKRSKDVTWNVDDELKKREVDGFSLFGISW